LLLNASVSKLVNLPKCNVYPCMLFSAQQLGHEHSNQADNKHIGNQS